MKEYDEYKNKINEIEMLLTNDNSLDDYLSKIDTSSDFIVGFDEEKNKDSIISYVNQNIEKDNLLEMKKIADGFLVKEKVSFGRLILKGFKVSLASAFFTMCLLFYMNIDTDYLSVSLRYEKDQIRQENFEKREKTKNITREKISNINKALDTFTMSINEDISNLSIDNIKNNLIKNNLEEEK